MSRSQRTQRMTHDKDTPSRNLFIAGFKDSMNDVELRALFSPYGTIDSAKVMLDIHTGASRGFAFVLFSSLEEATRARQDMNGRVLNIRAASNPERPESITDRFRLTVDFALHDAYNVVTRNSKVYCRNIPMNMDEDAIARAIESVVGEGTIVTVGIMPDSIYSPAMFHRRGAANPTSSPDSPGGNVAFIDFNTPEDAQRAVDLTYKLQLEGPGSKGPLMTKFAETAEVRSERKKRQPGSNRKNNNATNNPPAPNTHGGVHGQQPQGQMLQMLPPGLAPMSMMPSQLPHGGGIPTFIPMAPQGYAPVPMMMPQLAHAAAAAPGQMTQQPVLIYSPGQPPAPMMAGLLPYPVQQPGTNESLDLALFPMAPRPAGE